jgi:hypothetical protein
MVIKDTIVNMDTEEDTQTEDTEDTKETISDKDSSI